MMKPSSAVLSKDWRSLYSSNAFHWQNAVVNGKQLFFRRIGVVESGFDVDGVDFEGRADLNVICDIQVETNFTNEKLRRRMVLAWTYMRGLYALLSCQSLQGEDFLPRYDGRRWIDKCFVYERPVDRQSAIAMAQKHIVFMDDVHPDAEIADFYTHLTNTGRVIDATESLSKLIVMPFRKTLTGRVQVCAIIVAGHEAADGLTIFRWVNSFIRLVNMTEEQLLTGIDSISSGDRDPLSRLPPAQESLYPKRAENIARDRWNWAITRVLRHIHRPTPASFQNPLRRDVPLQSAFKMPVRYHRLLNYSKPPLLNCFTAEVKLPHKANRNLARLCKQAGISVGSGAFVLVAMVMMRLEEARAKDVPQSERLPFVGSFPLNPRPFLPGPSTTGKEDGLMLAFSDGITLPFIPSDLDLEKTFRVLGRLAHAQLRQYQKRARNPREGVLLGLKGPQEFFPALYLSTLERIEGRVKPEQRVGFDPSGRYPASKSATLATCGVSSVGDVSKMLAGPVDAEATTRHDRDIRASLTSMGSTVRPREGEFLVGAIGTAEGMLFRASCDSTAIDPNKARVWEDMMRKILDYGRDEDAVRLTASL